MALKKCAFIIDKAPYKKETSRLALTHAIASQSAEVYLDDGDNIEPLVAFIGDGILNCLKNQRALDIYGVTSLEMHIKNALLLGLNVYVCKEDLERLGLSEDSIVMDADLIGGESKTKIVSFEKIQELMEECDHLMFF
ncbi:MAG: DsrE family protein [Nitrospirota bacterium]